MFLYYSSTCFAKSFDKKVFFSAANPLVVRQIKCDLSHQWNWLQLARRISDWSSVHHVFFSTILVDEYLYFRIYGLECVKFLGNSPSN